MAAKETAFGTQTTNIGGGEALQYIGQESEYVTPWVDWNLCKNMHNMTYVQIGIIGLLVTISFLIFLRIFRVKSVLKMKGLAKEIDNINSMRSRDLYVMGANKIMKSITNIFEKSPLRSNKGNKDYIDYNLKRADIRVIGGFRPMVMEEFYAIIKAITILLCVISIVIGIVINPSLGVVLVAGLIVSSNIIPMVVVRNIVMQKDLIIKENFFDMYCKLHHSLAAGGVTPINKLLQIYAKTTDNPEMLRFVDNCCNLIETYNEYGATTLIADEYREIAEVGKLMRLIKQQADGADITSELIGFREELIEQEKYRLSMKVDKDITKVKATFNILIILLAQAVLSAVALYFPDMSMLSFM